MPKKVIKRSSSKLAGKQTLWKEISKVVSQQKSNLTQIYLGDVYQSYSLSSASEEVDDDDSSENESPTENTEVLYEQPKEEFVHVYNDVYIKVNNSKGGKSTLEPSPGKFAFGLTEWLRNFEELKKQPVLYTDMPLESSVSLSKESEVSDWQKEALAKVNYYRTVSRMAMPKEKALSEIGTSLSLDFGNEKTQFKTTKESQQSNSNDSIISTQDSMRSAIKEFLFTLKSKTVKKQKEGKGKTGFPKERDA